MTSSQEMERVNSYNHGAHTGPSRVVFVGKVTEGTGHWSWAFWYLVKSWMNENSFCHFLKILPDAFTRYDDYSDALVFISTFCKPSTSDIYITIHTLTTIYSCTLQMPQTWSQLLKWGPMYKGCHDCHESCHIVSGPDSRYFLIWI